MITSSRMDFQGNTVTCIEPDLESDLLADLESGIEYGRESALEAYYVSRSRSGELRMATVSQLAYYVSELGVGNKK
jgi:hypothetical protein